MQKIALCLGIFLFVGWNSPSEGGTLLIGKRAKEAVGKPKVHLAEGTYSVLILYRNERNPIHLEPIDAVIFNTGGGNFEKKRIRDRDQVVVLNNPSGRAGEKVTPETLPRYLSLLEENHMIPFVFQGTKGEERALIYTDPYNSCYVYETKEGLRVDVRSPSYRYRSLKENPFSFRVY